MSLNKFKSSDNGFKVSLIRMFALLVIRSDPSNGLFCWIDSHKVRIESVGLDFDAKKFENFSNRSAADRARQSLRPLVWGESSIRQRRFFNPGGSLKPVLKPDLSAAEPEDEPDPNLRL